MARLTWNTISLTKCTRKPTIQRYYSMQLILMAVGPLENRRLEAKVISTNDNRTIIILVIATCLATLANSFLLNQGQIVQFMVVLELHLLMFIKFHQDTKNRVNTINSRIIIEDIESLAHNGTWLPLPCLPWPCLALPSLSYPFLPFPFLPTIVHHPTRFISLASIITHFSSKIIWDDPIAIACETYHNK